MSTLAHSVRPLATASWSGKIPFVASDCKSASPIFISLKSSGSSLPSSPVSWSSISGQDDFRLRILLTSTRLLSVSDTLALFVFLRGSLVLFFSRFSGLSSFADLLFFCAFFKGIILLVFSPVLLKSAWNCNFVHLYVSWALTSLTSYAVSPVNSPIYSSWYKQLFIASRTRQTYKTATPRSLTRQFLTVRARSSTPPNGIM